MKNFTILITVLIAMTITANAQIPNSGFESWTTGSSYQDPIGWATMNMACTGPFYSCTKSTDHYPLSVGDFSVRIENNTSLGQYTGGWGMIVTDTFAYPFQPSFSITGHPTSLCGYYKYLPQNNDTAWVVAVLFHGDSVLFTRQIKGIPTSTWSSFNIPFPPYTEADSATILFSAYYPTGPTDGPNGNSVLYVDNLSFNSLISSVPENTIKNNLFILYPNPASDIVTLNIDKFVDAELTLSIYNIIGELISSELLHQNQQQINIRDLSNGIYMVEVKSKEWSEKQKLIIQR